MRVRCYHGKDQSSLSIGLIYCDYIKVEVSMYICVVGVLLDSTHHSFSLLIHSFVNTFQCCIIRGINVVRLEN